MSWLTILWLAVSALLFVLAFIEGNDEPFWVRLASAAFAAVFWLPLAIITVLWLAADWASDKLKARRK